MATLKDLIKSSTDSFEKVEAELFLEDISKTIKGIVEETAFYKNDIELNEIYISVLATLLGQLTLPKKEINRISNLNKRNQDNAFMSSLLHNINTSKGIVIGGYQPTYILVLTRLVKNVIMQELTYTTDYVVDESDLAQVLIEEELANNVKTEKENKSKTNNNK